ncbi:MAG: hypothetical protein ABI467_18785 [Kofleriaceae bacterium]
MLPVRACAALVASVGARSRGATPPKRLLHRLDELDRTTAFERIAERHRQARAARRLVAVAVLALLAVLATRAAAAPAPAPPAPPAGEIASDCDSELGCDDDGERGAGDDGEARDAADGAVIPRVVMRARGAPADSPCNCPRVAPFALSEVAAAAVRAAGLDHDPTHGWTTRARLAGLVPMLSGRVGRNLTWKEVDDPTLGYTTMFDVRATWRLERLLFDPNEIRIAAVDVSRRRERRRVETLAVHSYLAWLRVPRGGDRADLLAADLDILTDGWFSEALAKRGKP